MRFVYIERTGSHQQNSFTLEAKSLGNAQNASCELIADTQSEAQRIVRPKRWIFKQEPAEMLLHGFASPI
jgi:hypothetical protein